MNNAKPDKQEPKGLIVFDVEGILLPKRRYIPFEATRKLGFIKFLKIIFLGLLYEVGLLSLESALKRIYRCFKGYTLNELRYYYRRIPLIPGSEKVFEHLHSEGWKTALISSGLPNPFVQELAAKLKADYASGLKLKTTGNKFTGEIEGNVIKKNGKAMVLKEILKKETFSRQNCILVADDRNNLPMFPHVGLKIGYNPDFMLTAKSDHVVTGELTDILPIITKKQLGNSKPVLSRNEILRSIIHISGFTVPFICTYILNHYIVAFLIFLVTLVYAASEIARITGTNFPVFTSITTHAAVKGEPSEFAVAPIFYAFGIMLSQIIFPQNIAHASIAILTLGDGFASILGKTCGKTKYPFNKAKNLEGSLSGFIFAFLGATFFLDPIRALIGAISGMLVESLPIPINDNLVIPLAAGLTLLITFA